MVTYPPTKLKIRRKAKRRRKCGSYQLNEKEVHQSNGKASYAQGGFQTLHLFGALGSHLSGLGVRLPPVSSLACTPPGFAPRPLRPHLTQWQYKVALTSHWNKVAWYSATIQKFQTETSNVIFLMAYFSDLELELDGDVIPGSLSGSGGSIGAGVSGALGFEGGGLGAG